MKSNYKIMFTLLLVVLSVISIGSVSALPADFSYIHVVAEDITPEPVQPGQDLTVKLRLINDGSEVAEGVSLKLNTEYPFYVKTEGNSFDTKQTLCVGCSVDNTYYLVVDASAKSGLYPLNIEIVGDDLSIKPSQTINVKVVGKPDLVLETSPFEEKVSSGDEFTVDFKVKNIGTGIARNIKITPQSDDILMLGSNINLISEIDPDGAISISSKFIVKESLAPDTYRFPVNLEFIDEQGTKYASSFEVGLNVLKRSAIDIQSLKITPNSPTFVDDIHMEGIVENTGTGDADGVVVELITPNNIYKTFIGQLKSDDDAPFYFDLKPEAIGLQTGTLRISYVDDFGKHSFETEIEKEIRRPTNNLVTVLIVVLAIGLVAGYFYFKKKSTKK